MPPEKDSRFIKLNKYWWLWIVGGAMYGLLMRILFGTFFQDSRGIMSLAFLYATPFVIGALTIYGIRSRDPHWVSMIASPWVTVLLMLLGCMVTLLEGSICLAMMAPLFLLCGSAGGLAMGLALKIAKRRQSQLKAVVFLPLLVLIGETGEPLHGREIELHQSVHVNAHRNIVWNQILTARNIRPEELPFSLVHFIGVPKPVEGVNVQTPGGEVRYSAWERGVNFRAQVTRRVENESISWHYIFDENSFPPGTMDEHVAIGGRYFDLRDTTFNLRDLPGGETDLEIVAHYRVTSSVNLYAVPLSKFLGRDFIATILSLYKTRSEKAERSDFGRRINSGT